MLVPAPEIFKYYLTQRLATRSKTLTVFIVAFKKLLKSQNQKTVEKGKTPT